MAADLGLDSVTLQRFILNENASDSTKDLAVRIRVVDPAARVRASAHARIIMIVPSFLLWDPSFRRS
jgi:hypothetical protein